MNAAPTMSTALPFQRKMLQLYKQLLTTKPAKLLRFS